MHLQEYAHRSLQAVTRLFCCQIQHIGSYIYNEKQMSQNKQISQNKSEENIPYGFECNMIKLLAWVLINHIIYEIFYTDRF